MTVLRGSGSDPVRSAENMLLASSEMKEMKMLDLPSVDVDMLVMALEDHSYDSSWWFDPMAKGVEYCSVDDDPEEFESRHLVPVLRFP